MEDLYAEGTGNQEGVVMHSRAGNSVKPPLSLWHEGGWVSNGYWNTEGELKPHLHQLEP